MQAQEETYSKVEAARKQVQEKLKNDLNTEKMTMRGLLSASAEQGDDLDLPGGGDQGPLRKGRAPLLVNTSAQLSELTKKAFNSFQSTEDPIAYLDKFKVDVAASQSAAGRIPDAVMALNLHFTEAVIKQCYAESIWKKEIHADSKENGDTAHAELVSKLPAQVKEEKEEKKKKTLEAKLLNVQGSFVSFLDSDAQLTRCLDAAVRLFLRAKHALKHFAAHHARADIRGCEQDGSVARLDVGFRNAALLLLSFVAFHRS